MAMKKGTEYTQKTDEEYAEAIKKCHGNLSAVARELDIDRNSVRVKINNNPELKKIVDSERDGFIDLAEDRLYGCVQRDSIPAIMFTLKTIGRARGWGEVQEIITRKEEEEEYDLSKLTEEEKATLEQLTAKIYKPKPSEEKDN